MKNLYPRIMILIGLVVFSVLLYLCNTMVEPILSVETRVKYTSGDISNILSDTKKISNIKDTIFYISLLGIITCIFLLILSYAFPWLYSQKKKEPKMKESSINEDKINLKRPKEKVQKSIQKDEKEDFDKWLNKKRKET